MSTPVTVEVLAKELCESGRIGRGGYEWDSLTADSQNDYRLYASKLLNKFYIASEGDLTGATHVVHIQINVDEPVGPVSLAAGINNMLHELTKVLERTSLMPPIACGFNTETQGSVRAHIRSMHEWNTLKAREIQAAEGQKNEVKPPSTLFEAIVRYGTDKPD